MRIDLETNAGNVLVTMSHRRARGCLLDKAEDAKRHALSIASVSLTLLP